MKAVVTHTIVLQYVMCLNHSEPSDNMTDSYIFMYFHMYVEKLF